MVTEVVADLLGEESKGYMVRTNGGNHQWWEQQTRVPLEGPSKVPGPTAKCSCWCDQGKLGRGSPGLSADAFWMPV